LSPIDAIQAALEIALRMRNFLDGTGGEQRIDPRQPLRIRTRARSIMSPNASMLSPTCQSVGHVDRFAIVLQSFWKS